MHITNLNPETNIGASAWMLELEGHSLLMDAGTHPKREGREGMPLYGKVKDLDVDAIAITHCHHDHVGTLPIAQRYFPKAHVLMTELSYFLVERPAIRLSHRWWPGSAKPGATPVAVSSEPTA